MQRSRIHTLYNERIYNLRFRIRDYWFWLSYLNINVLAPASLIKDHIIVPHNILEHLLAQFH